MSLSEEEVEEGEGKKNRDRGESPVALLRSGITSF